LNIEIRLAVRQDGQRKEAKQSPTGCAYFSPLLKPVSNVEMRKATPPLIARIAYHSQVERHAAAWIESTVITRGV
jgi:hypothetical protein